MTPQMLTILAAAGVIAGGSANGDIRAAAALPAPQAAHAKLADGKDKRAVDSQLRRCLGEKTLTDPRRRLCPGWLLGGPPLAFGLGEALEWDTILVTSIADTNPASH